MYSGSWRAVPATGAVGGREAGRDCTEPGKQGLRKHIPRTGGVWSREGTARVPSNVYRKARGACLLSDNLRNWPKVQGPCHALSS